MTYPSISEMKDALGDIVLVEVYDPVAGVNKQYTFDDLPTVAQASVFQFIATVPNPPAKSST